jgi:adenosylhomocysteinase
MLQALKSGAVVCNIGHFRQRDRHRLHAQDWKWDEVKPQVHRIVRGKNKDRATTT